MSAGDIKVGIQTFALSNQNSGRQSKGEGLTEQIEFKGIITIIF